MGLLDTINGQGAGAQSGGCWTVFGGAADCTSNSYNTPVTLTVNGVTNSYSFNDVLPGGDNPDVTEWDCDDWGCIGLTYRCSDTISGCSCPAGVCPDVKLYRFDTSDCCCDLPCGGNAVECSYSSDIHSTISAGTLATMSVTSFILDGTQYVGAPVSMQPVNNIIIGAYTYNTSLVDTLASIGVPNMAFSYPSATQISNIVALSSGFKGTAIRIQRPDCQDFEIIIETSTPAIDYRWTQDGFYLGSTAASWTLADAVAGIYFTGAPINCLTQKLC